MRQTIIGVSGHIGSGKTTLSGVISRKWRFIHLSFGNLIEEVLKKESEEITRKKLQDKGEQMIRDLGCKGIVDLLFEKNDVNTTSNYVIDGIRRVGVYLHLREFFGDSFKLIFLEVPLGIRLKRIRNRSFKDINIESTDELRELENREEEIIDLRKYADLIILNTRDETYLEDRIKIFLKKSCEIE